MKNTRFIMGDMYIRATKDVLVIGKQQGMPLGTYMLKQHTTKLMRDRKAEEYFPVETINKVFSHVIDLDKTQVSIVNNISIKWLEATLELAKAYGSKMVKFKGDNDAFYVIMDEKIIPFNCYLTSSIETGNITIESFEIIVQELKREKYGTMMLTTTAEGHLKLAIGKNSTMSIIVKTY